MEAEKIRVKLRSLMFLFTVAQRDPSKVWSFLSAAFLELLDCKRLLYSLMWRLQVC